MPKGEPADCVEQNIDNTMAAMVAARGAVEVLSNLERVATERPLGLPRAYSIAAKALETAAKACRTSITTQEQVKTIRESAAAIDEVARGVRG